MRVVILAGGGGRRLGGGKPERLLGGISLLDRALVRARSWSDEVLVAGPGGDLADAPGIGGPLSGVAAALACGDVLTIPCDMPFLPDDLPARLTSDAAVTLAASHGRLHPVCALWRAEALNGLPFFLATGRRSLKGFAESVGHAVADWPAEPFDPFFNINTPDDLARAEALLRAR